LGIATREKHWGLILLRCLDGRKRSRVNQWASLHMLAGLDALLSAPVARGCETRRNTLVYAGIRLVEQAAISAITRS